MATQLTNAEDKPNKVAVIAGNKIAAFVPQTLEEAWRLAGALASSDMTPKAYGRDQNKIMVGIMAGAEVGLTPFAALQSIAIIGNNPSVWGDGALALVRASGLMEDFEETDTGTEATCRVVRKGQKTPIVRKFSIDDAKKAGLAGKTGPWTQYPARMRQMRARAFALRDGFADVLKGMRIVEEARDYASIDGGTLRAAQPLTATALLEQAQPSPASIPSTDAADAPNPGASGEAHLEGADDSQRGDLFDGAAQPWLDKIAAAQTRREVDAIVQEARAAIGDHDEVSSAAMQRAGEVS